MLPSSSSLRPRSRLDHRPLSYSTLHPAPLRFTHRSPTLVTECRASRPYRPTSSPRPRPTGNRTRRPRSTSTRERLGIRINEEIRYDSVRLLDSEMGMLGVYPLDQALGMARMQGVDLVLHNATSDPPLCRLMEWGKYKYELERRTRLKRQQQRASRIDLKELKMRPSTDTHDYQVRLRKAAEELGRGNHIKLVIQYRGREIQNKEEGEDLMNRFVADLGDTAVVERKPMMDGKKLSLILAPSRV